MSTTICVRLVGRDEGKWMEVERRYDVKMVRHQHHRAADYDPYEPTFTTVRLVETGTYDWTEDGRSAPVMIPEDRRDLWAAEFATDPIPRLVRPEHVDVVIASTYLMAHKIMEVHGLWRAAAVDPGLVSHAMLGRRNPTVLVARLPDDDQVGWGEARQVLEAVEAEWVMPVRITWGRP